MNRSIKLLLLSFSFLLLVSPTYASTQSTYLPLNHDLPVSFELINVYWEKPNQPSLRGADQFEIKWRIKSHDKGELLKDSEGSIYSVDLYELLSLDDHGNSKWKVNLKGFGAQWSPHIQVGKDGLLYAYSEANLLDQNDRDGELIALTKSGEVVKNISIPNVMVFSGYFFDTDNLGRFVTLTGDGLVYYGSDGRVQWSSQNLVQLGKRSKVTSNLYALDSDISKLKMDSYGNVYLFKTSGTLIKVDSYGKVQWEISIPSKSSEHYLSSLGYLYFVGETGVQTLDLKAGTFVKNNLSVDTANTLNIPNDGLGGYYVFYGAAGLMNVEADGKVKWRYITGENQYYPLRSIVSDELGNVYFANSAGNLYSLNNQGKEQFIFVRKNKWATTSKIISTKANTVICSSQNIGLMSIGPKQ